MLSALESNQPGRPSYELHHTIDTLSASVDHLNDDVANLQHQLRVSRSERDSAVDALRRERAHFESEHGRLADLLAATRKELHAQQTLSELATAPRYGVVTGPGSSGGSAAAAVTAPPPSGSARGSFDSGVRVGNGHAVGSEYGVVNGSGVAHDVRGQGYGGEHTAQRYRDDGDDSRRADGRDGGARDYRDHRGDHRDNGPQQRHDDRRDDGRGGAGRRHRGDELQRDDRADDVQYHDGVNAQRRDHRDDRDDRGRDGYRDERRGSGRGNYEERDAQRGAARRDALDGDRGSVGSRESSPDNRSVGSRSNSTTSTLRRNSKFVHVPSSGYTQPPSVLEGSQHLNRSEYTSTGVRRGRSPTANIIAPVTVVPSVRSSSVGAGAGVPSKGFGSSAPRFWDKPGACVTGG